MTLSPAPQVSALIAANSPASESPVHLCFLPDHVTVTAIAGEPLLAVARRAGVQIPTGCLMGSCHACEVEIDRGDGSEPETLCACISGVPTGVKTLSINLAFDPAW